MLTLACVYIVCGFFEDNVNPFQTRGFRLDFLRYKKGHFSD